MNDTPQVADPQPGNYYVSIIRNPGPRQKVGLLAGPFPLHQTALDLVPAATKAAEKADPRAVWDCFGTVRIEDYTKPGVLNAILGVTPCS